MSLSIFSFLSSLFVLLLVVERGDLFKLTNLVNNTDEVYNFGAIVGGQIGDYRQFPYIAKIYNGRGGYCGASILNANWVVTAAHCIKSMDPNNQFVRVGINSRYDPNIHRNQYQVAQIINHPEWRNNDGVDLALIRLKTPIQFRDGIKAGCVDYTEKTYSYLIIMGYGSVSHHIMDRTGKIIKYGEFGNELKFDYARENRRGFYCENGNMDMICIDPYYPTSGNGCYGDSGGPLVNPNQEILGVYAKLHYKKIDDNQYLLCIGHSAYTRLSRYSSFIDRHVGAGNYCARRK